MPSINEVKLFFLNRAKAELTTAIEKLNEATAPALPYRTFRAAEARTAYTKYLEYIQITGGDSDLVTDKIKAILPDFDATGTTHSDLMAAYNLIEHYAPNHDLESLVNLALRDFSNTLLYPLFEVGFTRIQAAVRAKLVAAIQAIVPEFDDDSYSLDILWNSTPYVYRRENAAQHAINQSRTNFESFFPYGDGNLIYDPNDPSKPDFRGTVGGEFSYPKDVLAHQQGLTGSAIFMSENIFKGSIPMTYSLTNGEIDVDGCSQASGSTSSGWRVCTVSPGATETWKFHQALLQYFESYESTKVGELAFDTVADFIDYANNGSLKPSGDIGLYALFNSAGAFAEIETGDIVFTNLGTGVNGNGLHSFLIVGWGLATNSYDAVNAGLSSESLGLRVGISFTHNTNTVPYVVDFGYGFRDGKTGWLQDPRPRPFYCSALTVQNANQNVFSQDITGFSPSNYMTRMRGQFSAFTFRDSGDCQDGCFPDWQFYHIHSPITIPFNRIVKEVMS